MGRNFNIITAFVLIAAASCVSVSAYAATNGALGASSLGTTEVTLTIPEQFRISNTEDLQLGTFEGGDMAGSMDLCIYSNGDGSFQVSISDNSTLTPGAFHLENTDKSAQVAMQVSWSNSVGAQGAQPAVYGSPIASTSADTTDLNCSSGMNASLSVDVLAAAMASAPPGIYTTELSLMIEPD